MKRFKFRLEKVREHRQTIKGDRRMELMSALRALHDAQETLEGLESSYREISLAQGTVLSSHNVLLAGMYGERLKHEIVSQRDVIAKAEQNVEEKRAHYVEASRDAEVLESLKKKKETEYQEMVDREIAKELDEIAVLRAGFKKMKVRYGEREERRK